MKIGIITHYGVHNHGAQLQLFALITILRKKNFKVKALQFEKDYRYLESNAKNKYSITFKSIPFYLTYLRKKGLKKTVFNINKKIIFDKFKKNHDILGEEYHNFLGDLIIIGSDEVFSVETGVTDAFWGNNTHCKDIVSYAASFGPTTYDEIVEKNLKEYIQTALDNFSYISVRDVNTNSIVNKLTNKKIFLVCDPVILYGYKDEIQNKRKIINKNFILLYSYDKNMNTPEEILSLKDLSKKLALPIYSIGFYHDWCDKNINSDPIDLLSYFNQASYIITDTFHGSVLSIITESNFAVKIRGNANKLKNLLTEYSLESRIFSNDSNCINVLLKNIDYKKVNSIIESNRKTSRLYLENILDNFTHE